MRLGNSARSTVTGQTNLSWPLSFDRVKSGIENFGVETMRTTIARLFSQ